MTTTVLPIIGPKTLETTLTNQYESSLATTVVTKFVLTNQDDIDNVSVSVHVVPPSGSADATNRVINERIIAAGEAYQCPEMLGQVLSNGWSIWTIATPPGSPVGGFAGMTAIAAGTKIT